MRLLQCTRIATQARAHCQPQISCKISKHYFNSTATSRKNLKTDAELDSFLSTPTWSVEALLPAAHQSSSATEVTPKQLHHLLRLAALPPPVNLSEETKMLHDLSAQLHFVNEIQKVDVNGVEPLQRICDETAAAENESRIDLEALKEALAKEEVVGRFHRRIRRKGLENGEKNEVEKWDVLGQAPKKVGRYFVVEGGGEG